MPIHKRDRNFQKIVSELHIKSVPTQYVQELALICENGDRINFHGDDLDCCHEILALSARAHHRVT